MDSFWLPDHLNALLPRSIATPKYVGAARLVPKADAFLEPWTVLGHLAARNRLGRLRLGIGVTDAGRRNPAVTAQAAATLHLLTRGRAILGIGTGEREGNEPYGVDWSRPVARFEEAIATIRALWDSGGELVTRDSPYFPLRNAVFDLPPYRGKWPEIWIASHGPRMLRATGRYADAWFPALMTRPKDYAAGLEVVRAAASDAGRDPMSIIPATWLWVVTGGSRDEVDEALGSDIMKAIALNWPAEVWARHGASHPMGDDFTGLQDLIPQTLDEQTVLSYTSDGPAVAAERGHAHRHTRRGHRSGCGVARPRPALRGDGRCQRGCSRACGAAWPPACPSRGFFRLQFMRGHRRPVRRRLSVTARPRSPLHRSARAFSALWNRSGCLAEEERRRHHWAAKRPPRTWRGLERHLAAWRAVWGRSTEPPRITGIRHPQRCPVLLTGLPPTGPPGACGHP